MASATCPSSLTLAIRGRHHFSLLLSSQACSHLLCPCSVETTTEKQKHGLLFTNQHRGTGKPASYLGLSGNAWLSGSSVLGTVVAGLAEGQGAQGLLAQTQANTSAQSGCPDRHHGHPSLGKRSPRGSLSGRTNSRSTALSSRHGGSSLEDPA